MLKIDSEKINTLSAMQAGRVNKSLSMKYNTRIGIMTLHEYIEKGGYVDKKAVEVPKVRYNRTKFNRMGYKEQADYEKSYQKRKLNTGSFNQIALFLISLKSFLMSLTFADNPCH